MKINCFLIFYLVYLSIFSQTLDKKKLNITVYSDFGIYQSGVTSQFKIGYSIKGKHQIYVGGAMNHLYSNSFYGGGLIGYNWKIDSQSYKKISFFVGLETRILFGKNSTFLELLIHSGIYIKLIKGLYFYPRVSFGTVSFLSKSTLSRLNGGFSIGLSYEF